MRIKLLCNYLCRLLYPKFFNKFNNIGKSAIEIIKKEDNKEFDVILLDFVMPVMCGPEAAKELRTELNYGGLIIGVTGKYLYQ